VRGDSVDDHDDARWRVQCPHRSFGGAVDVHPRLPGWMLLVVGAGPVELSVAQHDAALGELGRRLRLVAEEVVDLGRQRIEWVAW
jgi:hypothetical protein